MDRFDIASYCWITGRSVTHLVFPFRGTNAEVSVPECITATNVSVEDQLTLSISVAVGSTIVNIYSISRSISSAHLIPVVANGAIRHSLHGTFRLGPGQTTCTVV